MRKYVFFFVFFFFFFLVNSKPPDLPAKATQSQLDHYYTYVSNLLQADRKGFDQNDRTFFLRMYLETEINFSRGAV